MIDQKIRLYLKLASYIVAIVSMCCLSSCDDMEDQVRAEVQLPLPEPTQFFVLSEGLFNMNNSTLALYDLKSGETIADYFLTMNKRGLGDTANDMGLYGSKLYVVVNISSQIEVIDANTGESLQRIPLFDAKGIAREPRYIDFHAGKAYVCSFDGTVAKIDTTSMEVEGVVTCGKNPDGVCIVNDKIYVANSGGLNYPTYDNSVSVIDIASFTVIKTIEVGMNPYKLHADSEGDVYVVVRGDMFGPSAYSLCKISSITDQVTQRFEDIHALNFTIHNDTAYLYHYDYQTQTSWVKVFDCMQERLISENFISDGTVLHTPYGIDVNPFNGDVYVTDVGAFTAWGDVSCFDKHGQLKFKIKEIGLNPNKIVFR